MSLIKNWNKVFFSKNYNSWFTINLRLQYTFRSAIFFKFGFLVQINGRRVISNFWKQNWKKPNIGGEMEVLRYGRKWKFPLDWQPYNVYAINRDYFRGNIADMDTTNWLATELICIVNPSIFRIRCNSITL